MPWGAFHSSGGNLSLPSAVDGLRVEVGQGRGRIEALGGSAFLVLEEVCESNSKIAVIITYIKYVSVTTRLMLYLRQPALIRDVIGDDGWPWFLLLVQSSTK